MFVVTDDRSTRAGLYVLGLLSAAEVEMIERDADRDEELARDIRLWSARLSPLAMRVAPIDPTADLWSRVERQIAANGNPEAPVDPEPLTSHSTATRKLRRARLWAGFSGFALAASLALAIYTADLRQQLGPAKERYVVVLLNEENAAGFLIETTANGGLIATPLRDLPSIADRDGGPKQALELWTLLDPAAGPTSLGLLHPDSPTYIAPARLPAARPDQLFEVSLEPATGSTAGRPTGPVLFIGRGFLSPELG